jgi:cell wall integrity and stress response component
VTTVLIRTVSNQPVTQTVTSGPTAVSGADSHQGQDPEKKDKSGGVSAGVIAAIVIAVVLAIVVVAVAAFLIRRKRRNPGRNGSGSILPGTNGLSRNTSTMSGSRLLGTVYPSAGKGPRSHVTSQNQSFMNERDGSGGPPSMGERRNSRLLLHDQRVDPVQLLNHTNGSHVSVNTLPDNRDFTRKLNVC